MDTEELVEALRSFSDAYPLDVFVPFTPDEQTEHAATITRASASMGRHCAQFMVRAADLIEKQALSLSETLRDTERLQRFAEIARAVEGKDEGFGSELCASRELDFVREMFLDELAKGATPLDAFRKGVDEVMPTPAKNSSQEKA